MPRCYKTSNSIGRLIDNYVENSLGKPIDNSIQIPPEKKNSGRKGRCLIMYCFQAIIL